MQVAPSPPTHGVSIDLLEGCGMVVRIVYVACECIVTMLCFNEGAKCGYVENRSLI